MTEQKHNILRLRAHLAGSYGFSLPVWAGTSLTLLAHVVARIVIPVVLARWLASLSADAGDKGRHVAQILFLLTLWILLSVAGDYIFVRGTDARYKLLVARFHESILGKELSYFRSERAGSLGALFRDYMDGTIGIFRQLRNELLPFALTTIGCCAVLTAYSWRLGLAFGVAVLARAVMSYLNLKLVTPLRNKALVVYKELSGVMSDHMAQLPIIRASANYSHVRGRIDALATREAELFWTRHRMAFSLDFIANVIFALCMGFVIVHLTILGGGAQILETAVVAVVFALQGMQSAQSAGELYQRFGEHVSRVTQAKRELGGALEGHDGLEEGSSASIGDGPIQVQRVTFSYEGSEGTRHVFQNLDFVVEVGRHAAVVGENGAGKSTLVNLLMGFDRPQEGEIRMAGEVISGGAGAGFYRAVSYVPQDPKLFNDTVEYNLGFFEPLAPSQRRQEVFSLVGIDRMVERWPDGMDTRVGEMGAQISGGERQKIAIARALLRDTHIYLMDEPTSFIAEDDALNIIRKIRSFLRGRTLIVISHADKLTREFENVLRVADGSAIWERRT